MYPGARGEVSEEVRIRTVKDEGTGDTVGTYYYDDGGFRVRRISKREVDGKKYEHEILYTSMYMGLEIQKDTQGNVVTNSYAAVNNIYLNGLRIATIIPSGEVTYYLTDQVDSVKVVVNEQGLPVSRTEFHPYGETWFQEGNDNFAPKYNSQELDKESGLYFYNARYYDEDIGRFISADKIVPDELDTQSWNRYMYVKGNPLSNSDPSGNEDRSAFPLFSPTGSMFLKKDRPDALRENDKSGKRAVEGKKNKGNREYSNKMIDWDNIPNNIIWDKENSKKIDDMSNRKDNIKRNKSKSDIERLYDDAMRFKREHPSAFKNAKNIIKEGTKGVAGKDFKLDIEVLNEKVNWR